MRYYGYNRYSHPDAGANDEGYYHKWCYACRAKTEHEQGSCCACHYRRLYKKLKIKAAKK